MACERLGQGAHARAMLANGEALAPSTPPPQLLEGSNNAWLAWLYARLLLDEAGALLQSGPTQHDGRNLP
jgi:hypothetical protein